MLACRHSFGRAQKERRTRAPRHDAFGNASDATSYDGYQKRLGGLAGGMRHGAARIGSNLPTRTGEYRLLSEAGAAFLSTVARWSSPRLFGLLCVSMAARISILSPAIRRKPDQTFYVFFLSLRWSPGCRTLRTAVRDGKGKKIHAVFSCFFLCDAYRVGPNSYLRATTR